MDKNRRRNKIDDVFIKGTRYKRSLPSRCEMAEERLDKFTKSVGLPPDYRQYFSNYREQFRASLDPNDSFDKQGISMFSENDKEIKSMIITNNIMCIIFVVGIVLHIVALGIVLLSALLH